MSNKIFNLTQYLLDKQKINSGKTAVYWRDKTFTRKELGINVLKTGKYLRELGIKPEERVLLMLNDSPAFFDFFLGCIAIGAIPVPLNPKLKKSDINYILSDSLASAIILENKSMEEIDAIFHENKHLINRNKIIIQDRYSIEHKTNIFENRNFYQKSSEIESINIGDNFDYVLNSDDAPCFWQYTSGTTGKPKAVIHSQISMIKNTMDFAVGVLRINENDTIYSSPKMFFGYGLGNSLFFPFYTGAAVVIDDRWVSLQNIKENIEIYSPTIWFSVPKLYAAILKENLQICDLEKIRLFYSAGSNLNSITNIKWKKYSGIAITQGIGCTEIGHIYLSNIPGKENFKTTGIPVNSFNVKILDSKEANLKINQTGELWVQPSFKLLGYWRKPELTNEKFLISNWYRTGDCFYQDKTGNYIYQSRIDDLFKVNGRMVAPSVIENDVMEHFDISEAVFIAVNNKQTSDVDTILCLVTTAKVDILSIKATIIKHLSEKWPSYMIPNTIIFFDEFKYNVNGKIMRNEVIKDIKRDLSMS